MRLFKKPVVPEAPRDLPGMWSYHKETSRLLDSQVQIVGDLRKHRQFRRTAHVIDARQEALNEALNETEQQFEPRISAYRTELLRNAIMNSK